ncbi:putative PKS/NRPS-like protein biosynthetic cluster [Venturia effusa]|uniref:Putative PKS/NRPS-like protein biosynthetic cluster n=1 Tax=Venturia effusa TaxID=50376 RepID=A0A517LRC2_9PEZI|nr:putative PKS/NRPS-like protein biosynthetic cluster [Venturia effusa]
MPSLDAQAELIQRTYEAAGLSYDQTGYFETHGTGTPLGDPIELKGVASTMGVNRTADNPLNIGSIKPTIGHTEGCSGLAGLFKALHCIEQGLLVPTAGLELLDPALRMSDWHLTLPSKNMPWPVTGPRRASIASSGFGGSNAHVILDDAYHYLKERHLYWASLRHGLSHAFDSSYFPQKDQAGLSRLASLLHQHLDKLNVLAKLKPEYFDDLALTLAHRRTHHDFRSFMVTDSLDVLRSQLAKSVPKTKRAVKHNNNIFVFTGQGAQRAGMSLDLLKMPVFRQSIQDTQCLNSLGCHWDVIEELGRSAGSNIDKPEYSQPLCTAMQLAIIHLLDSWGIQPRATIGHPSGEIAAAYATKLISHRDAICIAYQRGVCSGKVQSMLQPARLGAMLAEGLSEPDAQAYIDRIAGNAVGVACGNSSPSVTLSGDEDAIIALQQANRQDDKFTRRLRVQTAYYSPNMLSTQQMYNDLLQNVQPNTGRAEDHGVLFFSSVTGLLATAADVAASFGFRTCAAKPRKRKRPINWSAVIELGPHSALQGPVSQILKSSKAKVSDELQYLSVLYRGRNGLDTALQTAGTLWRLGQDVDTFQLNAQYGGRRPKALADLPAYPFPGAQQNDFLGIPVENQNALAPLWENHLSISENPWIEQHCITGTILYPAAGMLIMVIEATCQMATKNGDIEAVKFHNVKSERGLVFASPGQAVEVSLSVQPDTTALDLHRFTLFSQLPDGAWTEHCAGTFQLVPKSVTETKNDSQASIEADRDVANVNSSEMLHGQKVDVVHMYDQLTEIGMQYGELFRNVIEVTALLGRHECHGLVMVPATKAQMPFEFEYPHVIHPATLDAIFAFADGSIMAEAAVPYTLGYMYVDTNLPKDAGVIFKGHASRTRREGRETAGDILVSVSPKTDPQIIICNFEMRQVTSSNALSTNSATVNDHSS